MNFGDVISKSWFLQLQEVSAQPADCLIFHLVPTGVQPDLDPSATLEAKLDESPCSSVMLTPVSEVSASDLVALSPLQVSPSSQLSEAGSDAGAAEVPEVSEAGGAGTELCSEATNNEEPRADEDKDPKKSKAHLHCPVCKVTVNSVSQLEAHNSGTFSKVRRVLFGDVEEETAPSRGRRLDCSVFHCPELVSELLLLATQTWVPPPPSSLLAYAKMQAVSI